jgi:hypothetical protein
MAFSLQNIKISSQADSLKLDKNPPAGQEKRRNKRIVLLS